MSGGVHCSDVYGGIEARYNHGYGSADMAPTNRSVPAGRGRVPAALSAVVDAMGFTEVAYRSKRAHPSGTAPGDSEWIPYIARALTKNKKTT